MKSSVSFLSALARLFAALLLTGSALAQPVVPSRDLPAPQLLVLMRGGGHILYVRHAATDFAQNDSQMKSFEDCAAQRNLVDKGRDDARKIGVAVRALRIPIGRVLSSPFCRTVE